MCRWLAEGGRAAGFVAVGTNALHLSMVDRDNGGPCGRCGGVAFFAQVAGFYVCRRLAWHICVVVAANTRLPSQVFVVEGGNETGCAVAGATVGLRRNMIGGFGGDAGPGAVVAGQAGANYLGVVHAKGGNECRRAVAGFA